MATSKQTVAFILEKLRDPQRFTARAMFGEYALYADGEVVALICDDRLYVKNVPASSALGEFCEQGPPFPGARPHYIVEEGHLASLPQLPEILGAIAVARAQSSRGKRKHTK